ncbi:MAG TPA: short chain dehydrogenase [Flavobacteriaceae bacterium]|jgi:short-subunit dehydrogenase|nr:short chain dehydrogenase [Flavobacteriaceae bacterium]HBS12760.1 short chain dehydrogenase [Flavobacteriaceae bacterium]
MNFKNKIIWITGASSGIGKAIALAFSEQESKLILSSRNLEKLEEVKQLCAYPDQVKLLKVDLDDYHNFDPLVQEAILLYNGIDILINNGGISQRSLAIETKITVDTRIFNTNYFGTIALTKALLPYFVAKKEGHFVIITSVVGKIGTPLRSSYAASKHALHGFFDSLRAEIHDDNIAVTLICPGFVKTDVSKNALTGDGSRQNTMDKSTENGLATEYFAKRMLKAVARKKQEVVIGGKLEVLAVYLKRFSPKVLAKLIRKAKVT